MTDLLDLAARVEAAEGPDRELDDAIHDALFDPKELPPFYTASLDAAMTLLPEGWTWLVDTMDGHNEACVHGFGPVPPEAYCRAATPALALCAASLKARAAS